MYYFLMKLEVGLTHKIEDSQLNLNLLDFYFLKSSYLRSVAEYVAISGFFISSFSFKGPNTILVTSRDVLQSS